MRLTSPQVVEGHVSSEHEMCVDVVGLSEGGVSRLCIGKSRARFSRLTRNGRRA